MSLNPVVDNAIVERPLLKGHVATAFRTLTSESGIKSDGTCFIKSRSQFTIYGNKGEGRMEKSTEQDFLSASTPGIDDTALKDWGSTYSSTPR